MTAVLTFGAERAAFRNGRVRRRQPCMACGRSTRRTVLHVSGPATWARTRYVLCTDCELPDPETRLLMAIFGVDTVPQLEAAATRARSAAQEAER
jgi:hypothetical protein